MSEIQRYSAGAISESEFGRFVLYSDYAQLAAERDAALRECERLREAALVVSSFEVAAGSDKEYTNALRNLRIVLGVSLVQDEDGNESKIM